MVSLARSEPGVDGARRCRRNLNGPGAVTLTVQASVRPFVRHGAAACAATTELHRLTRRRRALLQAPSGSQAAVHTRDPVSAGAPPRSAPRPCPIGSGHVCDEVLQLGRDQGTTASGVTSRPRTDDRGRVRPGPALVPQAGKEQRARRRERESQFTRALRLFRGSRRIFFEAGFALNIIVSLVKGLMP